MVAALVVSCFASGPLCAQNAPNILVSGDEVEKRTETVMTVYNWGATLDEVKKRAQKEKKLIFWLQIVGELDDGL